MINIRRHLFKDGITIRADGYQELVDEEVRKEEIGYKTYYSTHSIWTGRWKVKMEKSKGQLEQRLR